MQDVDDRLAEKPQLPPLGVRGDQPLNLFCADAALPRMEIEEAAPPGAPSASAESVSGEVKSTDPATNVVTVALPSGDEQKLSVDKDAQITRDGSTASISQLQPGDSVRASFDTKTNKASKLDVKSKSGAKKDSTQPEQKKM